MFKDQLSKTSGWQFHKRLFGPEKFSGLSRNGPQDSLLAEVALLFAFAELTSTGKETAAMGQSSFF